MLGLKPRQKQSPCLHGEYLPVQKHRYTCTLGRDAARDVDMDADSDVVVDVNAQS